jgi:hypothetical protein
MSQRKASKHKHTVCCTVKGCKYTSRHWVVDVSEFKDWGKSRRESVYSTKCPKHRVELVPLENSKQK